mgnify:CR=1 FL=1|jgi:hypothetical protein
MKLSNKNLPSNRKFGFFFTLVFLLTAGYFWLNESIIAAYVFGSLGTTFLLTALFKEDVLLPLNKLWMRFGLLLGKIISPIVLALIFFGLITPYSILMRLFGRDELRIKLIKRRSHWKSRNQSTPQTNFKQQF